jgi:hypothetical protein
VLGGEHSPKPFVPFFAQKVGIGFWCCFGLKNTLKNYDCNTLFFLRYRSAYSHPVAMPKQGSFEAASYAPAAIY